MRLSPLLTVLAALVALVVVIVLGVKFLQPGRPLLTDVDFSLSKITPNADGIDDITLIRYTLNRNANVTISFKNQTTAQIFLFRNQERRAADSYQVYFSGVVDGYVLPGETFDVKDIDTRLVPNGDYAWTISAVTDSGESASVNGNLTITDGDNALPAISSFDITPKVFTPNQDGYDDRISINLYLAKKATLTVYLEGNGSGPYYISERYEGRRPGDPGAHVFDYDGGVDNSTKPPADGDYTLIATAQDAEGQRVRRMDKITIKDGGLPNAEIKAQSTGTTVTWSTLAYDDAYFTTVGKPGKTVEPPSGVTSTQTTITLPQSDLILFKLTVNNYGATPLRTIGPWPGTVYQYDQTDAAIDNSAAISGAWRIGLQCERSETSYPWRWAIGSQSELTKIDHEGTTLWYLMPGKQAVVWGAVRMTKLITTRNPQKCYAALIHEDVAIPNLQAGVGSIDVKLTTPTQP